ncbi:MAG: hypothetical protein U5L45_23255 [Saprospiraceae bacterium]|nr:hypothetical protein [Saprospiraceae bacterium]
MPYLKQFLLGILLKTAKLGQKQDFNVIVDGSQTGSKHVTLMLSIVALAFCIMLNFGFNNQHNPLKIKVQRIDKKINSIFTFARLFF